MSSFAVLEAGILPRSGRKVRGCVYSFCGHGRLLPSEVPLYSLLVYGPVRVSVIHPQGDGVNEKLENERKHSVRLTKGYKLENERFVLNHQRICSPVLLLYILGHLCYMVLHVVLPFITDKVISLSLSETRDFEIEAGT